MDRGYTLLHRKIWDNKILKERGKPFSRREAWLYITNVLARGTDDPVTGLKRGEFEASYRYMAKTWNWSLARVQRFIADLQNPKDGSEPMLMRVIHPSIHSSIHLAVRFIVCKYDIYNPKRYGQRNAEQYTDRNKLKERIKESKKESKTSPAGAGAVDRPPSPEALELSEKLRLAIAARDARSKAARMPDLSQRWAPDIDKLLRIDGRSIEECESVIAWCQSKGCFWGPNIQSGKKFREKFDTMYGQMKREEGGLFGTHSTEPKGSTSEKKTSRGERIYIPRQ